MERWVASRLVPIALTAVMLAALVGVFALLARFPGGPPEDEPPTAAPDPPRVKGAEALQGVDYRIRVWPDGSVRVRATLTFASPVERLDLSVPARLGAGGPTRPVVATLAVKADGLPVPVGEQPAIGRSASIPLARPAQKVEMSYLAKGVTLRSSESLPGRALTLVTPVVIDQAWPLPWSLTVRAPKVLNVGCAGLDGQLDVCGRSSTKGWSVTGAQDDGPVDVLAQVDLPTRATS